MTRLIDADALIAPLKEEYKKVKQAFDETNVFNAPNDVALYGALMQELGAVIGMIEDAKTVDAEPVIRCKNCKFSKAYYHGSESNLGMFTYLCTQGLYGMNAEDYCTRAERKDNEAD